MDGDSIERKDEADKAAVAVSKYDKAATRWQILCYTRPSSVQMPLHK